MSRATANSSMALSNAKRYGVSGGARMKPGVLRSAWTTLTRVHTFGEAPRFMHERAGLDAEGFGGVARGDRAGGLRHRRHDDDGLAAQRRVFLLLAGGEEAIEIKNEPAQQFEPPRVRWTLGVPRVAAQS